MSTSDGASAPTVEVPALRASRPIVVPLPPRVRSHRYRRDAEDWWTTVYQVGLLMYGTSGITLIAAAFIGGSP